jgi:hypothetical protein
MPTSPNTLENLALHGDGALGAMASEFYVNQAARQIDEKFAARSRWHRARVTIVHFLTGYLPKQYRG